MKTEPFDGSREAEVLAGMVGHPVVLGRVVSQWGDGGLFPGRAANLVAGWCVEHFRKHGKPPRKGITSYFREWAATAPDTAYAESVGRLLETVTEKLSGDDRPASELIVDQAGRLFNRMRLRKHIEEIDADLEAGQVDKALARVPAFRQVELGLGHGADPLADPEPFKAVFNRERYEPLITYPGALGRFFADTLSRNSFVAFLGPEGSGKSFWLMDLAYRAVVQHRHKVAYFDTGDMTEDQVDERLACRVAKHPTRSPDGRWPFTVEVPAAIVVRGDANPQVSRSSKVFDAPLTLEQAETARQVLIADKIKSRGSFFRRVCFPNSTASVLTIRSVLQGWALDGWIPDAVIIDYADILAPLDRRVERRDQINDSWKAMRTLSQELHCLVVTATQANRESYKSRSTKREHIGEDKRKQAHLSALFTISQTEEEEGAQVQRIGREKRRTGGGREPRKQVYVAGCLAIANPAVKSCFRERGEDE